MIMKETLPGKDRGGRSITTIRLAVHTVNLFYVTIDKRKELRMEIWER